MCFMSDDSYNFSSKCIGEDKKEAIKKYWSSGELPQDIDVKIVELEKRVEDLERKKYARDREDEIMRYRRRSSFK